METEHPYGMDALERMTSLAFTRYDILAAIAKFKPDLDVFDIVYPVKCVRDQTIQSEENLIAYLEAQETPELEGRIKNALEMVIPMAEYIPLDNALQIFKNKFSGDQEIQDMDSDQFLKYLSLLDTSLTLITFAGTSYDLTKFRSNQGINC